MAFLSSYLLLAVFLGLQISSLRSETTSDLASFLRPGDHVVFVGDSITAANAYQAEFQKALLAFYPADGLQVSTVALSGSTAGGQVSALNDFLTKNPASILCVMFGVNDTGWSPDNGDAKEAQFMAAMDEYQKIASAHNATLILLRETNFTHDQAGEAALSNLNGMLDRLQNAQTAWAAKHQVPIIDLRGAYQRDLREAWQVDPKYQFTPDVVHPSTAGNAMLAIELLRVLGVGLPLAPKETRGPLNIKDEQAVTFHIAGQSGVTNNDSINLTVTTKNGKTEPRSGEAILYWNGQVARQNLQINVGEEKSLHFPIDIAPALKTAPIYIVFTNPKVCSAGGTMAFSSDIQNLAHSPFNIPSFPPGKTSATCPVSDVQISWKLDVLTVDFTWKKAAFIRAAGGFKSRLGPIVDAPLDLTSPVGQPCDAVEFFLDPRPETSMARPTTDADSNIAGTLRIGVYWKTQNDAEQVEMIGAPALPPGASIRRGADNRFTLELPFHPHAAHFGFSMAVTSATEFKPGGGDLFRLTGNGGLNFEPMSYLQFSPQTSGHFFRIGY